MNRLSFENIYTAGEIVYQSDLYVHYHYPEMLIKFDSNYLKFQNMPTLTAFKEAATYLYNFHLQQHQYHVKFTFPENRKPTEELIHHFLQNNYAYSYLELFSIQPDQFPRIEKNMDIAIELVTAANFDTYLQLQYQQDISYGKAFAEAKPYEYRQQFQSENVMQILSYFQGNIAGSVDVILDKDTAEIDSLFVLEEYRRKGIATRLQQFVMDQFPNKTIILVADGEGTPREMYINQNYRYLGFQYEAIKIFKEEN
ncbi:hypothetical protein M948_09810 [Virgibacillus sp. CM-4]|uniref:GNAT family N-acetyltransferase n=1 Tax=Virgibacillus sp. CM-4 TaxID=1354277 RepID=UPI00038828D0|nr:GNAT family N-acetyltransferase [Virgibacillus sp. CM-4]EQB37167.1 hypothetical protein M948_09810 [Virgibacillus sp. CM-4]